jgi:DnaJ-class molecular chaperone
MMSPILKQRSQSSQLKRAAADHGYRMVECPSCWGGGVSELDDRTCRHCGGSGRLWLHPRLGTISDAKLTGTLGILGAQGN